MDSCIFCQIINHIVKAEIVLESQNTLVIKDKFPKAPIHLLVLPKEHFSQISDIPALILKEMFDNSAKSADNLKIAKSGYRLAFNVGRDAGQEIEHIHLHVMGGGSSKYLY